MKYKLLNKLFGWDYVAWSNSADQGIARVLVTPDGKPYYWRYKISRVLDRIERPDQVVWLTCKPEKYFENL